MKYRILGKTGFKISEVSLGTWQVGGKWGSGFDHVLASKLLQQAIDEGVNFIDTADVYEAGESEKAVGKIVKQSRERIYVATKCGRQISPHVNAGYTPETLRKFVEQSLTRMGLETIDLIQLHCPPTEVYYRPEIFREFEKLKQEGKILNLGVSVEKVEEALKAIEYENVTTVQIIFNIFRQRPSDFFFKRAAEKNIGIIARVPLASGLLTGTFNAQTKFEAGDHRFGNRKGEWFDKGETFAGIPYEAGLEAAAKLKELFPEKQNISSVALKWILMHPEVSCVIPGASSVEQIKQNLLCLNEPEISSENLKKINTVYNEYIKTFVHHSW